MRRTSLSLIFAFSLGTAGLLWGGGQEAGDKELKKLQGTWKFTAQVMDGKERPADELKDLKITFAGDKFTVREGDKVVQAGTHKFNVAKKPIQVDAQITEGEGKGSTMLGIYEMKGDMVKVCFDPQGKERPTSFTAKEGQFSAVIQREKKK